MVEIPVLTLDRHNTVFCAIAILYIYTACDFAGDRMLFNGYRLNGKHFTTRDQDNDQYNTNCAIKYNGGWGYNNRLLEWFR